jgi:hypothetical protein
VNLRLHGLASARHFSFETLPLAPVRTLPCAAAKETIMRILSIVATLATCSVLVLGCDARTVCDDAFDKVTACGLQDVMLTDSGDTCGATAECQAKCFNATTCGELKDAAKLQMNALTKCLDACR